MKKVVGGKLYNTETATEIGSYSNGLSSRDFRNVSESLFKTKSGTFFLAGEGGPLSKYARSVGSDTFGDEDLVVLSPDEAQKWAEQYLDADTIVEHFNVSEE